MKFFLRSLKRHKKTIVAMVHDAVLSAVSIVTSFYIAFGDFRFLENYFVKYLTIFTILFVTQLVSFNYTGLYKGIWRYSSTLDLLKLIRGATLGVVFSAVFVFYYNRLDGVPRFVFFIEWLLLIVGLGGGRLGYRVVREHLGAREIERNYDTSAVIVGAGAAGEQLAREIRRSPHLKIQVVSFVDDDLTKRNKVLHGVSISGGISDLNQVVKKYSASMVYIAISAATSKQIDRIVRSCRDTGVEFKTLPKINDILHGEIIFSQLRDVKPEDLLGREETVLDTKSIKDIIEESVIMVTGAGGSIGSELCRQIAKFKPSKIIFFEIGEFNLYRLEQDIKEKFPSLDYELCIADVRDRYAVERIIKKFSPKVVFHAAAYKHVPIMEINPREAIKTNIFGTHNIAEISAKNGVERFVLVSTDKAVRPTNIMGATKRVAEMVCQEVQSSHSGIRFMLVRFGNVLGSSGSVIPLFKKQIQNGGPITITHPEVTRFFMSIPEACQLVMQSGAIGCGGEVFLLDMGKSVKIVHLAKQMISLSGYTENEISLKYTGLRPGEKLFEELLLDEENVLPTIHPLLKVAKLSGVTENFRNDLLELESSLDTYTTSQFKDALKLLVKDYVPSQQEEPIASSIVTEETLGSIQ